MTRISAYLLATALLLTSALPAAALTTGQVLAAMNARIAEITIEMDTITAQLETAATVAERNVLRQDLRMLNVRRSQLISLQRVVPRYPEQVLIRIATFYNLDVSLA